MISHNGHGFAERLAKRPTTRPGTTGLAGLNAWQGIAHKKCADTNGKGDNGAGKRLQVRHFSLAGHQGVYSCM